MHFSVRRPFLYLWKDSPVGQTLLVWRLISELIWNLIHFGAFEGFFVLLLILCRINRQDYLTYCVLN